MPPPYGDRSRGAMSHPALSTAGHQATVSTVDTETAMDGTRMRVPPIDEM